MMDGRYIHWCAIETGEATTGTADAYGEYTTVVTTQSTRCTFKNGGLPQMLESGAFARDVPTVIMPASTAIVKGDRLVGVSAGWARAYVVTVVRTIWNRCAVDHVRCDLEAV